MHELARGTVARHRAGVAASARYQNAIDLRQRSAYIEISRRAQTPARCRIAVGGFGEAIQLFNAKLLKANKLKAKLNT